MRVRRIAVEGGLILAGLAMLSAPAAAQRRGGASADSLALSLVRRIGALDGPPEIAFGQIASLLPLPDGGFYTCDSNDLVVRRYRSDGGFVGQVGRRGAGPGEYRHCMDIDLIGDTTLVVSDPGNARFVFFRPDGTFDRVVGAHVAPGLGGGNAFFVDTRGRLWKRGSLAGAAREVGEGEFGQMQFVILEPTGNRVDSVLVPRGSGSRLGRGFALSTNDGMYQHAAPDTVWATTKDGAFVVAGTDAYLVEIRRPGQPAVTLRRDARPVPYAREEQAQWDAWRTYFSQRSPQFPPAPIPSTKPAIRGIRVDAAGTIWVQVHVAAEPRPIPPRRAGDARPLLTWRERNTYDLFDSASGRYVGRVAFPYATILLATRGNRVWLSEEGEAGESLIGIYEFGPVKKP